MSKPLTKEEFIIRHSAYFQSIGFDVQFAAFIYYSLDIGYEDAIHYESEEDFVIDRVSNGQKVKEYYQVKHSKDNSAKMTNADTDFWKTIDNWIELYNLSSIEEKKNYFTQGKFIIITNKEIDNKFYTSFVNLRNGVCEIHDVIKELKSAYEKSTSYKKTLGKLIELGKKDISRLNQFLHKVVIIRFDDFLESLYDLFLQKYQRPAFADQIMKDLIVSMWKDKFKGEPPSYTGEEFTRKYKGILERVSYDETLTLENEDDPNLEMVNDEEASLMIEQLKSVEVISADSTKDDYLQAYYLAFFFKIKSAIENFKKLQIITNESESRLDKSAISQWKSIFIKHHNKILQNDIGYSSKEKIDAGNCTLNDTLDKQININGYKVDEEFSKGWYLRLSNTLKIVWHYDWFKKYILKNE